MRLLFAFTLFVSAALLFWVQPLFSKMVLPLLGGSPSVWNTSLVVFQALLLAGYLYAHLLTRWLGVRRATLVHLIALSVSLLALPITVPRDWTPPTQTNPIPWLIGVLIVALGAPFFMLASTAPLLQRWFASLDHPAARNPYTLYATSNLGSISALVLFPIALEPLLRLTQQSIVWAFGYGLLWTLTASCALAVWRSGRGRTSWAQVGAAGPAIVSRPTAPDAPADAAPRDIAPARRLRWIALAFIPSSLLLGVTTYLTTDVAAVPLFWVVPLALYLLSFVIVFSRVPLISHRHVVTIHGLVIIPLVIPMFWAPPGQLWWVFPAHLFVFFITGLLLHGELVKSRPDPTHLTEFYLWMALGGVLGGAFNALLAPLLFDSVPEYAWMLALACLFRPSRAPAPTAPGHRLLQLAVALVPALLLGGTALLQGSGQIRISPLGLWAISGVSAILIYTLRSQTGYFATALILIVAAGTFLDPGGDATIYEDRGFFGTHSVHVDAAGRSHYLSHGTTVHGAQYRAAEGRNEPLTYYHRGGPFGQAFTRLSTAAGSAFAVVGLGTGSLACYGSRDQRWTFYEIDPGVERIARDTSYFTFLADCPPAVSVVLGDARLSLAAAPDGGYDMIVLDAFSSDAIPVHLLTREALALYLSKLADGGVVFFHISNRYMDPEPVLASLSRDAGLVGLVQNDAPDKELEDLMLFGSDWAALARDTAALGPLLSDPRWRPLEGDAAVWTDDFSNIFSALRWR